MKPLFISFTKPLLIAAVTLTLFSCNSNYDVANTNEEFISLITNPNSNIAHNLQDFERMIKENNRLYTKLRGETLERFKEHLKFKNGGLSGANYDIVVKELGKTQFDLLWNIFGISPGLFKDYQNKECSKAGTCSTSITDICTSNC